MCIPRFLRAVLLAGLLSPAASGHEFWLEPSSYTPASGAAMRVELRHGERFRGDVVPRRNDVIDRFTVLGPEGEAPVVGRSGGLASFARPQRPGIHVVAYHTRHMMNRLDAARFEAYLREEGLERISAIRAERGETDRPGREMYSRCAKSLIAVDGVLEGADRQVGLPLEIVLETAPADVAASGRIVASVWFRERPLDGVTVVAVSATSPEKLLRTQTDANGRVELALPAPGPWMLTTIHMVPAPPNAESDWESFWASLTFAR